MSSLEFDGELRVDLVAAGGVVIRRVQEGGLEVALCGRMAESLWALPKGTPEKGESLKATARREVREETGLEVGVGPHLGHIQYSFVRPRDGAACHKVVHFFLMWPTGGDTSWHDREFDKVEWCALEDAARRLTHATEAHMMRRALSFASKEGGAAHSGWAAGPEPPRSRSGGS